MSNLPVSIAASADARSTARLGRRSTMRALRLVAPREPLQICELPVPEPAAEEALIRVAGCGVCHTDIGFWQDGVATRHAPPLTLGHEISGVVVAAGAGHHALIGREVIVPAVLPCGSCDLCHAGRGNACRQQRMPGNDMDGGFAEYVVTPARGLCVVEGRGDYALSELSVIADAVATPYQAVMRSGLRLGNLAVVVGAGGIGAYAVQIASAQGAKVIAIDIDDARLALVSEHGAGLSINATRTDFRTLRGQVLEQAKAWGCPPHSWKLFECSGHPDGQQTAWGLLTPAATLVVVGFTLAKIELRLSNLMALDATVHGVWGCVPELYPAALDLVTSGRVVLRPFVERHPMSRGADVLRQVAKHELGRRPILEPDWDSVRGPRTAGAQASGSRPR